MNDASSRKLALLCVVVVCVSALSVAAVGSAGVGAADAGNASDGEVDWSSFQSDRQNTGNTSDVPAYEALSAGWTAEGNSDIDSGPAVVNGTAYVADGTTIRAVDAGTGTAVWNATVDGVVYGTPAYANQKLYVASAAGTVYAINSTDGSELWSVSTDGDEDLGAFYGSVTTGDSGNAYVAGADGFAYKIAANGSGIIGSAELTAPAGRMTPAIRGDRVYIGDRSGNLTALSTDLGTTVFTKSVTGSGALTTPAVDPATGRAIVTTTSGSVAAYGPNGTQVWRNASHSGSFASVAIHGDFAVVGATDGTVTAHTVANGSIEWSTTVPSERTFGSAVSTGNETVFVGTDTGVLALLDVETGEMNYNTTVSGSPILTAPTVYGDRLLVGTEDGAIRQFEARKLTPATPVLSSLSIAGQGTSATVDETEEENVVVSVENTGELRGTFDVTLNVTDGDAISETQSVTLTAGDEQSVSFSSAIGDLSPGNYTVTLRADSSQLTGSLTVVPPTESEPPEDDANDETSQGDDSSSDSDRGDSDETVRDSNDSTAVSFFARSLDPATSEVSRGDAVSVSAKIDSDGTVRDVQDVNLRINNETVKTRSVNLSGGGTTTVEFTNVTVDLSTGEYELGVYTTANSVTGTITVVAADGTTDDVDSEGTSTTGNATADGTDNATADGAGSTATDDTSQVENERDGPVSEQQAPGFGITVVFVALIVAALIGSRRDG